MKRSFFCVSVVSLVFGFLLVPGVYSQGVTISVGNKVITIPKEETQKVKETVQGRKPRIAANFDRGRGDRDTVSLQTVERLARSFRLTEKTSTNPQLAFGGAELSYWQRQNLSEPELELQFEARRIILDAADRQNVRIQDQETLSRAAREFIRKVSEDEDPSVKGGAQINQAPVPDVSDLICEGDTSESQIRQAWEGLNAGNGGVGVKELEKALACTKVAIDTWSSQADEQQAKRLQAGECKVTPKAQ